LAKRVRSLALTARGRSAVALAAFIVAWVPVLAGVLPAEGAGPGTSQCVACHTDPAKLKALTPPDPPPSEEGEG
jgi:mono/diheme cytochrome c family protein